MAGHAPPGGEKTIRRAARLLEQEHHRERLQAQRDRMAAELAEVRARPTLPAMGEKGPQAGRHWWRLRLEPHRATSDVLAVAYPFLAEEGLGSVGSLIGVDYWSGTAFVFDPFTLYERKVLTNPNMLLAGALGRGKSMLAKSLACRQIAFGRRIYIPGDVKGEWSVVADAVGGAVIRLGVGSPIASTRSTRAHGHPTQATTNGGPRSPNAVGVFSPRWRRWRSGASWARRNATPWPSPSTRRSGLGPGAAPGGGRHARPAGVGGRRHGPQLREDGRQVALALGRLVDGDLAGLFDGPSTVASTRRCRWSLWTSPLWPATTLSPAC